MKIHQIINSYDIEAGGAERLVVSIHDFISKKIEIVLALVF